MRIEPLYIIATVCLLFLFFPKQGWSQSNSEQALEDILAAYEKIEFELAEARIESALEKFELFSASQLTEIHTTLALIKYTQNDLAESKRQFEAALRLTPGLELDPLQASPKVIEFFKNIAAEIKIVERQVEANKSINYIYVDDLRPAAAMRSMVLPGWGQHYKGQKSKGYLLMSIWSAAAAGTLIAHLERNRTQKTYLAVDPSMPALIEKRYRKYDGWHRARNNLFIGTIGVWAFAYIDALITSKPSSNHHFSLANHIHITAPMFTQNPQVHFRIRF